MIRVSALFSRFSITLSLSATFCAAQNGDERPGRILNRIAQIFELFAHQIANRRFFYERGYTYGRTVGTMSRAKCVIHKDFAINQCRQFTAERFVVLVSSFR